MYYFAIYCKVSSFLKLGTTSVKKGNCFSLAGCAQLMITLMEWFDYIKGKKALGDYAENSGVGILDFHSISL